MEGESFFRGKRHFEGTKGKKKKKSQKAKKASEKVEELVAAPSSVSVFFLEKGWKGARVGSFVGCVGNSSTFHMAL